MDNSTPYRQAMHRAKSADEVAEILRRFMATLDDTQAAFLDATYAIARYTDTFIGQVALRAARDELMTPANDPRLPVVTEVGRVLSTAALRLGVLKMDARKELRLARRRRWFKR